MTEDKYVLTRNELLQLLVDREKVEAVENASVDEYGCFQDDDMFETSYTLMGVLGSEDQIEYARSEVLSKYSKLNGMTEPSESISTAPDELEKGHRANHVIKGNIYEHYKGGQYQVITAPARMEDDGTRMVVYQKYGQEFALPWVRSEKEFTEVLPDGTPRFKYIGHSDA